MNNTQLLQYVLQLADNAVIIGHRISEWCGHGPVLEQDIALTNTALDHIGQARSLYQYAAEIYNQLPAEERAKLFTAPMLDNTFVNEGKIDEDDLPYLRDAWDYMNVKLAELPNGDWAYTIIRSFFIDTFNYYLYTALKNSKDKTIAAVAEKSLKEVRYHLKWSSEWVIRLGDGTEESNDRLQAAIDDRWAYTGELFAANDIDKAALKAGIGADLSLIQQEWLQYVKNIFEEATVRIPDNQWMHKGGKEGVHTEHLGYILAEMQFLQRAYPGMEW